MAAYSPPPVPPRPYSAGGIATQSSLPPPVPPLPPGFRIAEEPLTAPRPQRLNPDIPADMARTLDEQLAYTGPRLSTPQPPSHNMGINYAPGFAFPGAPPPLYSSHSLGAGPTIPMPQIQGNDGGFVSSMGGLSLNGPYPPRQRTVSSMSPGLDVPQFGEGAPRARTLSTSGPPPNYDPFAFSNPSIPLQASRPGTSSPRALAGPPSLTAPLPTISSLQAALPTVQAPNADVASKIAWIRDVLLLVNRSTASTSDKSPTIIDPISGPARITDPALQRLADAALPLLMSLAPGVPAQGQQLTAPLAEALHMRACLTASGTFPSYLPQNQRTGFRESEAAARSGYSPASWFRLGRDYESFGDVAHAVSCFDRGARAGDESCLYRLGMANLLGQLGMKQDYAKALPMLQRAATLASISIPQPAYVYTLVLLGDLSTLPLTSPIPQHLIAPLIPPGSTGHIEARKHLERAAYLHFTPAQYKLGHAYEFAEPPFPFDPLLSVQYYSLASQSGEAEADLALSRWFLCGSDGGGGGANAGTSEGEGFKRDENLAFVFGEKAAKKGLPAGEFAVGYYWEVGVGVPTPDIQKAIGWYEFAAAHGNTDAAQRLAALKNESSQALTRQEHEALTEHKLVRKRTQAKQRSDASGARVHTPVAGRNANQVVEGIRKNSQMQSRQSFQPRQSSLGATAEQQVQSNHSASPPPMPNMPSPNPNTQDPMQRLRDRPRYSLVDPGASTGSSPPPGRTGSPRLGAGRGGRVGAGGYAQSSPKLDGASLPSTSAAASPATPPSPPAPDANTGRPTTAGGVKYSTFAEMGVQGGRAEEKDCVIM